MCSVQVIEHKQLMQGNSRSMHKEGIPVVLLAAAKHLPTMESSERIMNSNIILLLSLMNLQLTCLLLTQIKVH